MIKIIKQKKIAKGSKVCDIGDILYGDGFFIKPHEDFFGKKKFLPLAALYYNPWHSLEALGIDFEKFKKELEYEDYVEKRNIYYWAIPIFLFSDDVDEIIDKTKAIYWKDIHKDHEWQVRSYFRQWGDEDNPLEKDFRLSKILEAMLGHGYTYGTIPSDGSGEQKNALVELSDGNFLGCKVWVWYNK